MFTTNDFDVVVLDRNGCFVRIAELNEMIKCGAITINREKLQEYQTETRTVSVNNNGMEWTYSKRSMYWCASRKMPDGVCQFVYTIHPDDRGGYVAYAMNNAYGAERVAVKSYSCTKQSVFEDLEKLMADIANGNTLWLYTGFCNCVGKVTKEEY